jgi:threonine dehydratase
MTASPSNIHISLESIREAKARIAPYIRHTPMMRPPLVHRDVSQRLHFKLENLQVSGSFKARGVFNTLLQLSGEQRARGAVTASGGNHGVALAYAASRLGLPATVFLPSRASEDRVARIARFGAKVIKHGDAWDDANAKALEHAEAEGLAYVPAFDGVATVEGQGTLGLEMLEDLPDMDCLFIAIGGGGLIAGVAAAIRQRNPNVAIIGVEPVGAPSMQKSFAAGQRTGVAQVRTIADTLAPRSVSDLTFQVAHQYVDKIHLIDDRQMVQAMRWLWAECNQLVEPAGAAVVAALLDGGVDVSAYAHPVALICGGNAAAESVFASYQQAADMMAGIS